VSLEGKSVIVTGAGQGIGRAIALRLAQDGADLLVAEMNMDTAESVAAEINGMGRRGVGLVVNVTSTDDRARMVETALREFGKIDVMVNNAGVQRVKTYREITEQDWDLLMDVNAKATFFCCQAVLPEMVKRKSGKIINLASQAGKLGAPFLVPYAASKAAVISLTRSLALAVASDGINVNCVCPGFMDTKMWDYIDSVLAPIEGLPTGGAFQKRVAQIPLGRAGTPEDVANVVSFLASSDSDYMTAQAINITGGYMIH
jgi:acetoin reductase-like protein